MLIKTLKELFSNAKKTKTTNSKEEIKNNIVVENIEIIGTTLKVSGWAIVSDGIKKVEVNVSQKISAKLQHGISRQDVEKVFPKIRDSEYTGFSGEVELDETIHSNFLQVEINLFCKKGNILTIGKKLLPGSDIGKPWLPFLSSQHLNRGHKFHIILATSGISQGGACGIIEAYGPFESRTVRIGIRVPILYMRTTLGTAHDYKFDPEFNTLLQKNGKAVADDNLASTLAYSASKNIPVLLTLNGGIWGDAGGSAPEWDLTDHLEQNTLNCQWNQHNEVMPDDALKKLLGSQESPELGRCLTFNIYATSNREYKKRNIQEAAKHIRIFASQHPELFLGINIDPDLYLNPFFEGEQWYDYNPGTIKQFRHWLGRTGPYSNYCPEAQCDYRHYSSPGLTLAELCEISKMPYIAWDEVDPPRSAPVLSNTEKDKWIELWEQFRRHLVKSHYDEISLWLIEAGIESNYIFSSQGFMAPESFALPFATEIESPLTNYDSGGMSVAGSKPTQGHLGAIIYGNSAVNCIRMGNHESLFANLRSTDPEWAVVEYNTADLRAPKTLPGFSLGYDSMRHIFNYGARFVSPMAWNGSNGTSADEPNFDAFTALRNTPLEEAIKRFMYQYANIPRGAIVWTFGNEQHSSKDGWTPGSGTSFIDKPGSLTIVKNGIHRNFSLISPKELVFNAQDYRFLTLSTPSIQNLEEIVIEARTEAGNWKTLIIDKKEILNEKLIIKLNQKNHGQSFQQIALTIKSKKHRLVIDEIVIYPELNTGKPYA